MGREMHVGYKFGTENPVRETLDYIWVCTPLKRGDRVIVGGIDSQVDAESLRDAVKALAKRDKWKGKYRHEIPEVRPQNTTYIFRRVD